MATSTAAGVVAPGDRDVWNEGEKEVMRLVDPALVPVNQELGNRILRSFMPMQHRQFFNEQPFMAVGSLDEEGWPWASLVFGRPGFISSPTDTTLLFSSSSSSSSSPLSSSTSSSSSFLLWKDPLRQNLKQGAPLGLLGIQFHTRRRNRANGRVKEVHLDEEGNGSFLFEVDLSFGNCPKYIQARQIEFSEEALAAIGQEREVHLGDHLNNEQRAIIANADTFFIASSLFEDPTRPSHGVDVSHRGGKPGFVQILEQEGHTFLLFPDYVGNFFFNTLGNLWKNPKCGLLFLDFESGDVLQVKGEAKVLMEDKNSLPGAQRMVRVEVKEVRLTREAVPFRWRFLENSPFLPELRMEEGVNPVTGMKEGYRLNCIAVAQETLDTLTFTFNGGIALTTNQKAGQYATFELDLSQHEGERTNETKTVVRTWTIASAPQTVSDYSISVTVKRKEGGLVSNWLHDRVKEGSSIFVRLLSIGGEFTLEHQRRTNNVVMIAGGVGITPFMSMLRGMVYHPLRKEEEEKLDVRLVYSVSTSRDVIFEEELKHATQQLPFLRVFVYITRETGEDEKEERWNVRRGGRLTKEDLLRVCSEQKELDVFLCGPEAFMQSVEEMLADEDFPRHHLHTERFNF